MKPIAKLRELPWGATDETGGYLFLTSPHGRVLKVIASWGGGWDHVSVSVDYSTQPPTWAEMEFVKRTFFRKDECAMQLHVPEEEHINVHPGVLHIWRPQKGQIPMPPRIMV